MSRKLLFPGMVFLFFVTLNGFCCVFQENSKKELQAIIDSIIQSQVSRDKIPGAVILIKKGDEIILHKAYGYAQKYDFNHMLLDRPEKMTVDHLFDIASLTKAVATTTSVMILADRGMIRIDDKVCRYIKDFNTPEKGEITIRHLLTHTAGLYEWYPLYYLASQKTDCYRLIASLPLAFKVGEQRHYSDLGFVLLGEIIEIVSELPFEKFIEQNIAVPLEMKSTLFNPLASGKIFRITATSAGNPYEKRMVSDSSLGFIRPEIDPSRWNGWRQYVLKGEVNDGNSWYANGGISGAAGLFSTAGDLQKLVDMLINKGMAGSKRFLSDSIITTFLTKDRFKNGLGWMMDPANSFMKNAPEGSFGHTGFTGTSISVIPKFRASVILLINRQNTGLSEKGEYYNINPIREQVFDAVMRYVFTQNKKQPSR